MKPITTTLLMGLIASVACVFAAYNYPWPEQETTSTRTGEFLFEEFPKQVWSIEITKVNEDPESSRKPVKDLIETIKLSRKGQKWVIKNFNDYVATGAKITSVIGCLNEKKILQEDSDNEQDHPSFGLIDPDEPGDVKKAEQVGDKITMRDSNDKVMGSLIIGNRVKNAPTQFYVREPGDSSVLIVDFDKAILTSRFADWLDLNLLGLQSANRPDGIPINNVLIDDYTIDPTKISDLVKETNYRCELGPNSQGQLDLLSLKVLNGENWESTTTSETSKQLLLRGNQQIPPYLFFVASFYLTDVENKTKTVTAELAKPFDSVDVEKLKGLNKYGFIAFKGDDGKLDFDGTRGEVVIRSQLGVNQVVLVGNKVEDSDAEVPSYYMMVYSELNEDYLRKPEKPEPKEGQDSLSDDEEKQYARMVDAWEKQVKESKQLVTQFNRTHSGWYYAVNSQYLRFLFPNLTGTNNVDAE